MLKGLLIEDDRDGINRARRCAPNAETLAAYTRNDIQWEWVMTYDSFCHHITKFGMPDVFAFDHDLHSSAYELWHKHKGYEKEDINYNEYEHKTGFHCAQFLVEFCLDNNIKFEAEVYSHSMNFKGRENILSLLNNFKKHQNL